MSVHFSRDFVWLAVTDDSFLIPYQKLRDLGINGIYRHAGDTLDKFNADRNAGFKVGIFYPASTTNQFGADVARAVSSALNRVAPNDAGQTAVLLDFEPSYGSTQFWKDFIEVYRALRSGRVTDFTPEPFKATQLPTSDLLNARFDVRVQYYFGDMSPVDGGEAREDWEVGLNGVGFPKEAIRGFVDGGRVIKPPIFYQGRKVRNLEPGTIIWNANLLRESGLI